MTQQQTAYNNHNNNKGDVRCHLFTYNLTTIKVYDCEASLSKRKANGVGGVLEIQVQILGWCMIAGSKYTPRLVPATMC